MYHIAAFLARRRSGLWLWWRDCASSKTVSIPFTGVFIRVAIGSRRPPQASTNFVFVVVDEHVRVGASISTCSGGKFGRASFGIISENPIMAIVWNMIIFPPQRCTFLYTIRDPFEVALAGPNFFTATCCCCCCFLTSCLCGQPSRSIRLQFLNQ
jgi:hypothetical protein